MSIKLPTVSLFLAVALGAQKPPGAGLTPAEAGVREWFPTVHRQIEVEPGQSHVVAEFGFRNPRDEAIHWRGFAASCACSHIEFRIGDRHYWLKTKPRDFVQLVPAPDGGEARRVPVEELTIAPHEAGVVEVHVDLHSSIAKRSLRVDLHTTDAAAPMIQLGVDLSVPTPLVVTPPEVDLGLMAPDDKREFEVEVHAPGLKDLEILRDAKLPPGVEADWQKVDSNGVAIWRLKGSYGPIRSGKGSGALLKFATNSKLAPSFTVRLLAEVAPPIAITPGFVSFGPITAADGKQAAVRFHASNGTDLEAVSVRFENLSGPAENVASHVRKEGKDLIVEILVPAGAPRGLCRGDLLVELNHELAHHRVLFNGYVR